MCPSIVCSPLQIGEEGGCSSTTTRLAVLIRWCPVGAAVVARLADRGIGGLKADARQGWLWKHHVSTGGGSRPVQTSTEAAVELFRKIDTDLSGSLSTNEVRQLGVELGRELSKKELLTVMAEMGTTEANGAQVVHLQPFINWLERGNSSVLGGAAKGMVGVASFAPKLALNGARSGAKVAMSAVPIGGSGSWSKWWCKIDGECVHCHRNAEAATTGRPASGGVHKISEFRSAPFGTGHPASSYMGGRVLLRLTRPRLGPTAV